MNALGSFAGNPAVLAAGWALLHSVWQLILIAVALSGANSFLKRRSPRARYLAACTALLFMLLCPLLTFALICWQSAPPSLSILGQSDLADTLLLREVVSQPLDSHAGIEAWLPVLVGFWAIGVFLFAARAVGGWLLIHRMCRRALPVGRELEARAADLAFALGVRQPFEVRLSHIATVPSVVGCFRAVILFPAAALIGLPTAQLEAVLAHELAHIRRHDYLVNLIQTAIESLLFYHPAVWWVSGRIRAEREHCCDDAAVALTGDLRTYANALVTLEELRASRLAVAANGGDLLPRIRRILGEPSMYASRHRTAAWLAGVLALTLAAAPFAFARSRDDSSPKPPTPAIAPSAAPAPVVAQSHDPFAERTRAVLAGQNNGDEIAALKARIADLERENQRLRDSLKSGRPPRAGELRPDAASAADLQKLRDMELLKAQEKGLRIQSDDLLRQADEARTRAEKAKLDADLFRQEDAVRAQRKMAEDELQRALIERDRANRSLPGAASSPPTADAGNKVPVLSDVPLMGRLFQKPGVAPDSEIAAQIRALREENRAMQRQLEDLRRQIESLRSRKTSSTNGPDKRQAALEQQREAVERQLLQDQLVFTEQHPRVRQLRDLLKSMDQQAGQPNLPAAADPLPRK